MEEIEIEDVDWEEVEDDRPVYDPGDPDDDEDADDILLECPACDGTGSIGGYMFEEVCTLCVGAKAVDENHAARYDPDDDFLGAEPTGGSIMSLAHESGIGLRGVLLLPSVSTINLEFSEFEFENHDLSEITFVLCDFDDAVFTDCDLSSGGFDWSNLSGCRISECRLDRTTFEGCDLSNAHIQTVDLSSTPLEAAASLTGLRLVEVTGLTPERTTSLIAKGAHFFTVEEFNRWEAESARDKPAGDDDENIAV